MLPEPEAAFADGLFSLVSLESLVLGASGTARVGARSKTSPTDDPGLRRRSLLGVRRAGLCRLGRLAAVGLVEARALEDDPDGSEHLLQPTPARGALLQRVVAKRLDHLQVLPALRARILVCGHRKPFVRCRLDQSAGDARSSWTTARWHSPRLSAKHSRSRASAYTLWVPERLTHLDPLGGARMVDVTPKEATHRRALARCKVMMAPATTAKVASNAITKGDVLGTARIAGIQAAKRTADLIPMCHPLLVGAVHVNFTIGDDHVEVEAQVETVDRTGVEMEAMTACAVAALTIYDMCKSADRGMEVGHIALWEKSGGSGRDVAAVRARRLFLS